MTWNTLFILLRVPISLSGSDGFSYPVSVQNYCTSNDSLQKHDHMPGAFSQVLRPLATLWNVLMTRIPSGMVNKTVKTGNTSQTLGVAETLKIIWVSWVMKYSSFKLWIWNFVMLHSNSSTIWTGFRMKAISTITLNSSGQVSLLEMVPHNFVNVYTTWYGFSGSPSSSVCIVEIYRESRAFLIRASHWLEQI